MGSTTSQKEAQMKLSTHGTLDPHQPSNPLDEPVNRS